jgi:nucleoside 2-deoxyribosyltransferase
LFNDSEKEEMALIAAILERNGHETFLPQRDGLELAGLRPAILNEKIAEKRASEIINSAIFSFDIYKLLNWSHLVVANLNGRVPDEGTIVEATLAWHAGKGVVLYKNDARSLFSGDDNPMVTGLSGFAIISSIDDLPAAAEESLNTKPEDRMSHTMRLGEEIAAARELGGSRRELAQRLVHLIVSE